MKILPEVRMPELYERRLLSEGLPAPTGKEEMTVHIRILGTSSLKVGAM
jgi:hypothetical protein